MRKVDDSVIGILKKRAAEKGHSAEEEHRQILQEALTGMRETEKMSFTEYLVHMPLDEGELEIEPRDREQDDAEFETMFD